LPRARRAAARSRALNLFYQATSIGQYHGTFSSPYAGPFSLRDHPERVVSLTTRSSLTSPQPTTQLIFDPEIAGGKGFSGVNGVANAPNGSFHAWPAPLPSLTSRVLYVSRTSPSEMKESVESDANQLAGTRPMMRYSVTIGRFTITDFFDNNRYSHDPRTQFMGWASCTTAPGIIPPTRGGYTWVGFTNSMRATGRCATGA